VLDYVHVCPLARRGIRAKVSSSCRRSRLSWKMPTACKFIMAKEKALNFQHSESPKSRDQELDRLAPLTDDSKDKDSKDKDKDKGSKACCFCWCCCCSCSCLSVKNVDENTQNGNSSSKNDHLSDELDSPPPLADIKSWADSFEQLMQSRGGRKFFRDFLRLEYSEENILFWLAVEELKNESNPAGVEEKARVIYEDYISILSPKEVSLDSKVREVVNRNMVDPTSSTFDEAQLQIYTLMHRDSYPRFINSPLYKKLAQIENGTNSRRESNS